jgi:hypothetical protein
MLAVELLNSRKGRSDQLLNSDRRATVYTIISWQQGASALAVAEELKTPATFAIQFKRQRAMASNGQQPGVPVCFWMLHCTVLPSSCFTSVQLSLPLLAAPAVLIGGSYCFP